MSLNTLSKSGLIITDELGKEYWKPHERSYKLMSKKLNVDLSEMVYIGDNEAKDFVTANLLGVKTIRIERINGIYKENLLSNRYKAKYKLDCLEDLLYFL